MMQRRARLRLSIRTPHGPRELGGYERGRRTREQTLRQGENRLSAQLYNGLDVATETAWTFLNRRGANLLGKTSRLFGQVCRGKEAQLATTRTPSITLC